MASDEFFSENTDPVLLKISVTKAGKTHTGPVKISIEKETKNALFACELRNFLNESAIRCFNGNFSVQLSD